MKYLIGLIVLVVILPMAAQAQCYDYHQGYHRSWHDGFRDGYQVYKYYPPYHYFYHTYRPYRFHSYGDWD